MTVKRRTKSKNKPSIKSPKRPKASSKLPIALFLIAAFFVCLLLVCMSFWIDAKVVERLKKQGNQALSAIYSDMLTISPRNGINLQQLKEQLIKRRYRETSGTPMFPGEFHLQGQQITILTREFRGPDGIQRNSTRIVLGDPNQPEPEQFSLEPQVVAVLGDGDMRSEENKSLSSFPQDLRNAVISIEDERFYTHHGIDLQGTARAMLQNLRAMSIVQGGSTITQQLAKNLFFSPTRSYGRKILELFASFSLERHLSKEQILEMYLNEIYLGQEGAVSIHGFAKAASVFFGKKVEDLSLAESAMLAGIIKAPSYYAPRKHLERASERRDVVLAKMLELNKISQSEYESATRSKPIIINESLHQRRAPHFTVWIQNQLQSSFNVEALLRQGLSLYSGIDIDMQECAETAVNQGISELEKAHPSLKKKGDPLEIGLVAIEPYSGKIRAWVGGRNYSDNQFDHVALARRQIGSTVKPFLYLTALDGNLNSYKVASPISILPDKPMKVDLVTKESWEPENYDRGYHGDVTLRFALENSLNIPAVYVAQKFGVKSLAKTLESLHIGEQILPVPSLALGAIESTLLNLTSAYGALANGGIYTAPRPFISAVDRNGEIISTSTISEQRIADENAIYVLTDILKGVIERGTAKNIRKLGYEYPVAGKTGTSNDTRDNWFVGFTPDLVTGVWLGYDDNKKTGMTGGAAATPIWTQFMQCVARFHTPIDFIQPQGVVTLDVDPENGNLVTEDCPSDRAIREVFVRGTEPTSDCRSYEEGPKDELPTTKEDDYTPRKRKKGFWESLFG